METYRSMKTKGLLPVEAGRADHPAVRPVSLLAAAPVAEAAEAVPAEAAEAVPVEVAEAVPAEAAVVVPVEAVEAAPAIQGMKPQNGIKKLQRRSPLLKMNI